MNDLKAKAKFKEGIGYRLVAATGAFGGPTPSGDLLCNFFLEYRSLPEEINIHGDPQSPKPIEVPIFQEGDPIFIRELQVGILLNPAVAKAIGEWLIKRAEEIMTMKSSTVS